MALQVTGEFESRLASEMKEGLLAMLSVNRLIAFEGIIANFELHRGI